MDNSNGLTGAAETPEDAARRIKDSASTVIERGKEAAATAIDRGKEAAMRAAEQGAQRVAGTAESTASALRRAAEDVDGENAWIGTALRKSADGLEQVTQSLSSGDISRSLDDLNGFARRNPALFLGASLAVGFALARVGKTAIETASDGADGRDDTYSPMPGL